MIPRRFLLSQPPFSLSGPDEFGPGPSTKKTLLAVNDITPLGFTPEKIVMFCIYFLLVARPLTTGLGKTAEEFVARVLCFTQRSSQ
jgi:hypothetical protein